MFYYVKVFFSIIENIATYCKNTITELLSKIHPMYIKNKN